MLWRRALAEALPHEGGHVTGSYASASPVTDGERVVASFGSRGVFGLDLDGAPLWEVQLGELDTKHAHGEGGSPVLHGDTVVVVMDHEGPSFVVALDAATGEERWRRERDEPTSWATPIVVERGGRAQVIVSGTNRMRAYDLATGAMVWECDGLSNNVVASPVARRRDRLRWAAATRSRSCSRCGSTAREGDMTDTERVLWVRPPRDALRALAAAGRRHGCTSCNHYQGFLSRVDLATGDERGRPLRLSGMAQRLRLAGRRRRARLRHRPRGHHARPAAR